MDAFLFSLSSLVLVFAPQATRRAPPVVTQTVAADVGQDAASDGGRVLFLQRETSVDLNGDGDLLDEVLALHDMASGVTLNLGLALIPFSSSPRLQAGAGRGLAHVSETAQGGTDLNGDGDVLDAVFFGIDLATGTVSSSGLASRAASGLSSLSTGMPVLDGVYTVIYADELRQGQDLDGNGFVAGSVPHAWGSFAAPPQALGLTGRISGFHQSFLLCTVGEQVGSVDRNGDGDTLDQVLYLVDLASSNSVTNLALAMGSFEPVHARGDHAAFLVWEAAQGSDLNLDGDALDHVPFVLESATGTLHNLGLAASQPSIDSHGGQAFLSRSALVLSEDLLAITVRESDQGGLDRNGDGDASDWVLAVHDLDTGSTQNVGLAAAAFDAGAGFVAFSVREADQGQDLGGSPALSDYVLHLWRPGSVLNLGFPLQVMSHMNRITVGGPWIAVLGEEAGTDRNGDGDSTDPTLILVHGPTGSSTYAGSSAYHYAVLFSPGGHLTFTTHESNEGRDLDGDGMLQSFVHLYLELSGARVMNSGELLPGSSFLRGTGRLHPLITRQSSLSGPYSLVVARLRF
ncbi:MAG TPA: hypothetical protein VF530_20255 [Planctomycetota bacterium]